jgi:hypothetical protein
MENCAGYDERPSTLPVEVDVRFVALFSLFDRT